MYPRRLPAHLIPQGNWYRPTRTVRSRDTVTIYAGVATYARGGRVRVRYMAGTDVRRSMRRSPAVLTTTRRFHDYHWSRTRPRCVTEHA